MPIHHIGLISESPRVPFRDVAIVSAALQKQLTRDFTPIWDINATVDPFESIDDLPMGYWPIVVVDRARFSGFHLTDRGVPMAIVKAQSSIDLWSHVASHEILEMLVDPFGDRTIASDSPKPRQGRVEFLVEVADPCQHSMFGYSVNGIVVSDFYTPNYFDPVKSRGVRYSLQSSIKAPKEVLPGGYLSWYDPETDEWWQATRFGSSVSSKTMFRSLGTLDRSNGSMREQIDALSAMQTESVVCQPRGVTKSAGMSQKRLRKSSLARAKQLRIQIDKHSSE